MCSQSFILKDVLPVLISSLALFVSVLIPYLLIRYEKVFLVNKEYKDFLRQAELFFLEWLNITSSNLRLVDEFLLVIKDPRSVFIKDFQSYDFPAIDFFKTYNIELLNEFYVQVRKLKDLDHHQKMIGVAYSMYKGIKASKDAIQPLNGNEFFTESLYDLKEQYPKAIDDISKLRIKVRLLLRRVNGVDSLKANRFFSFSRDDYFWFKKDLHFSNKEIQAEESVLKGEKEEIKG